MLERIRKAFSANADNNVAEATHNEENVEMTTNTEQLSAVNTEAELTALVASQAASLTETQESLATLQASFAELNNKYTEAAAKLAEVEAAKASLVADAAAAIFIERKRPIELQSTEWMNRQQQKIDLGLKAMSEVLADNHYFVANDFSLADARAGKRQLEYRDIFRYFRPKELKEEELDRVLDILAENQVQILDEGEEQDAGESEPGPDLKMPFPCLRNAWQY
jgi:hypothetical protein